jgi:glucose/arabinose dehydrogenase
MTCRLKMSSDRPWVGFFLCVYLQLAGSGELAAAELSMRPEFSLPDGFSIEVLVPDVPNARSMALGDDGTLFVATQRAGKVYAVSGAFSDKPRVITLLEGRKMPNGVAFRDGALYVAEPKQILRLTDIENRLDDPGEPEIIVDDLPYKNALHAWKYIAFGPDGRLYVPLGAPCNICNEPGFGLLMSMRADGSQRQIIATGIRNTVGFDWHPLTKDVWFTDNGRDMLGDDIPPCELNYAPLSGLNFGFPYCHGDSISDPEFGELGRCDESRAPVQALGPHVSPLGMKFYTGTMFPEKYRNQIFIAEHGSWNRSKEAGKTGYRLTLVRLKNNEATSYEAFLEGFLNGDEVLGRPVDLLIAPDGSMLVSDDTAGVIYRISYASSS